MWSINILKMGHALLMRGDAVFIFLLWAEVVLSVSSLLIVHSACSSPVFPILFLLPICLYCLVVFYSFLCSHCYKNLHACFCQRVINF